MVIGSLVWSAAISAAAGSKLEQYLTSYPLNATSTPAGRVPAHADPDSMRETSSGELAFAEVSPTTVGMSLDEVTGPFHLPGGKTVNAVSTDGQYYFINSSLSILTGNGLAVGTLDPKFGLPEWFHVPGPENQPRSEHFIIVVNYGDLGLWVYYGLLRAVYGLHYIAEYQAGLPDHLPVDAVMDAHNKAMAFGYVNLDGHSVVDLREFGGYSALAAPSYSKYRPSYRDQKYYPKIVSRSPSEAITQIAAGNKANHIYCVYLLGSTAKGGIEFVNGVNRPFNFGDTFRNPVIGTVNGVVCLFAKSGSQIVMRVIDPMSGIENDDWVDVVGEHISTNASLRRVFGSHASDKVGLALEDATGKTVALFDLYRHGKQSYLSWRLTYNGHEKPVLLANGYDLVTRNNVVVQLRDRERTPSSPRIPRFGEESPYDSTVYPPLGFVFFVSFFTVGLALYMLLLKYRASTPRNPGDSTNAESSTRDDDIGQPDAGRTNQRQYLSSNV